MKKYKKISKDIVEVTTTIVRRYDRSDLEAERADVATDQAKKLKDIDDKLEVFKQQQEGA